MKRCAFILLLILSLTLAFTWNSQAPIANAAPVVDTYLYQQIGQSGSGQNVTQILQHGPYLFTNLNGLTVLDILDPANPTPVANPAGIIASDMAIRNGYLFVLDQSGRITTFDIADPANPQTIATLTFGGPIVSLAIDANTLFVGAWLTGGVRVVDISDVTAPVEIGSWTDFSGGTMDIFVRGAYVYGIGSDNVLRILDITDRANPTLAATWAPASGIDSMVVDADRLYLSSSSPPPWSQTLSIYSLADPLNPTLLGAWSGADNNSGTHRFTIEAGVAYLGDYTGLVTLDVANPATIRQLGTHATWIAGIGGANGWCAVPYGEIVFLCTHASNSTNRSGVLALRQRLNPAVITDHIRLPLVLR